MESKMLSIITNFGCHWKCPYCIVKNNDLKFPKTDLHGLDELSKVLDNYDSNLVSVSGGGDPLYGIDKNKDVQNFFSYIFAILERKKMENRKIKLELHTSIIESSFPYFYCERVCFHVRTTEEMLLAYAIHSGRIKHIRFVFVVDENMTEDAIDLLALRISFFNSKPDSNSTKYELTFRQMVGENYETKNYHHEYLKKYHKQKWFYVTQEDYNDYYVNGKIYYKYQDISITNESSQNEVEVGK